MTRTEARSPGPAFLEALAAHREVLGQLERLAPRIEEAARLLAGRLADGGTLFWLGNGGSAADSQHLAAELVGRFEGVERPGRRSIALTADASALTSLANDMGFERVFSRQLEALCRPGDAVVALSTSGASANVVAAVRTARQLGATAVALTGGDGGAVAEAADLAVVVPSASPARAQEAHLLIGHYWCEAIHARFETP